MVADKINEMSTNDDVSFKQPGPGVEHLRCEHSVLIKGWVRISKWASNLLFYQKEKK